MAKKVRSLKKNVRKCEHTNIKLTPAESDVLTCLTKYDMGIAEIAVRRQTGRRAVERIRKRLERKGLLELSSIRTSEGGVLRTYEHSKIRLHALQWKVAILHSASWEKLSPRVIPEFMGCHISVGEGYVEIYAKDTIAFQGDNEWDCFGLALEFFERLGRKLEVELRCQLIRPRSQNWELVKHEFATEGSKVAKRHIGDGVPLRVFAREDGHLWFWGDWSKKAPEHETRSKVDSEEVNKHLNDWRDFRPPTNSQLAGMISRVLELHEATAEFQKEQAAGLATVLKLLSPQEKKDEDGLPRVRPFYVG